MRTGSLEFRQFKYQKINFCEYSMKLSFRWNQHYDSLIQWDQPENSDQNRFQIKLFIPFAFFKKFTPWGSQAWSPLQMMPRSNRLNNIKRSWDGSIRFKLEIINYFRTEGIRQSDISEHEYCVLPSEYYDFSLNLYTVIEKKNCHLYTLPNTIQFYSPMFSFLQFFIEVDNGIGSMVL